MVGVLSTCRGGAYALQGMHWFACGLNIVSKTDDTAKVNWIENYFGEEDAEKVDLWVRPHLVAQLHSCSPLAAW